MSLRISSAALVLMLAACAEQSPPPPGDDIECAIGPAADFSGVCTLEKTAGSPQLILHHPDGGFRRVTRDPATGNLAPLDGAEPLVIVAEADGVLQFAIGADRYRIPSALLDPPPQ